MIYFKKIVQSNFLKKHQNVGQVLGSIIALALLLSCLIIPVNASTDEELLTIPTLDAPVEVVIDQWGIPHIYAESVSDAYTALGYFHARDRLYQMYRGSYRAAGRLSEIQGESAIESDKYYRTVGLARAVEKTLEWYEENVDTNPDAAYTLSIIDASVNGVNAYIDTLTSETMPRELKVYGFTPPQWTRKDVLLLLKNDEFVMSAYTYYFFDQYLQTSIGNETMVSDLYPNPEPFVVPMVSEQYNLSGYIGAPGGYKGIEDPPLVQPVSYTEKNIIPQSKLEELISWQESVAPLIEGGLISGCNAWVVDGTKTATGKPILANEQHLGLQVPSNWYEVHLIVPGILDVTGLTEPGIPAIMIGHNSHTSWALTQAGVDVVDVFVEEINPLNPDQYLYNGEWRDFEIVDETIHTKEGNDVPFSVKWSVHGPLVDSMITTFGLDIERAPNLAVNWTGHSATTNLVSMSLLNKANNLSDYYDALYYWDVPPENILYADDQGNIASTCAGRFPVRAGYSGKYPVKALNDSVGVIGYIPYNYLPRTVNPSQHFIQSANQMPIDPEAYGYDILGTFVSGYRGRRIHDLLSNDDDLTMEDMMVYQADSLEVFAQRIVPFVVDAWDNSGVDNSEIQSVVDELRNWDYVMDTDEAMPTFWSYLIYSIRDLTFEEVDTIDFTPWDTALEDFIVNNKPHYFDNQDTPDMVESRDDILVDSLFMAFDLIVDDFGGSTGDWLWGDHHIVVIEHPEGLGSIESGGYRGGEYTLNVAPPDLPDLSFSYGATARIIVDLGTIEESYCVNAGGQSGNSSSPHWDDMYDLWYTFDETTQHYGYHDMYFYSSAAEFGDADMDGSMIESVVRFEQEETSTGDVTKEEPDIETNGGIPGYPVWSIGFALLLVSYVFYTKQHK
jgi:penicillin amidase